MYMQQMIMDTVWGAEKWFLAAELTKAHDKVSHVAMAEALKLARVPVEIIRWIMRFLKGKKTSILLAGNLAGQPFDLQAGMR